LNDTFTIIDNDGTDAVVGQFAGGTTIRAFNNPLVTFSIDYGTFPNNDVIAKVTDISKASALVDVQGGQVIYFSNIGINNNVGVTRSGGAYTISEGWGNISLSSAAKAAGWTGDGTTAVSGPTAGVTGLSLGLSDGSDVITGIDAGSASVSLSGVGTLT